MEKKLFLYDRRLKSHHDSNILINKYIKNENYSIDEFNNMLQKIPDNRKKSIYVHTPYCDKICSFCNLNRKQIDGSLDIYAQYIADEFKKYGKTRYFQESEFEVIFFGGGTPTVYNPHQLELILKSIKKNVTLSKDYEFTFETTLHNLSDEKLEIMKKYGVNRLSIGIQTFSDEGRKFYNRTYMKKEVIQKLKKLKDNFCGDLCVDIIYNFPAQKIEDVIEDAKIIKNLELSSVSFYSLMVHEGSKLSKDIEQDKVKIKTDIEREYLLYENFVNEMLSDGNYHILELTKIAKNNGDNYKYIKIRNSGGDTFPIGIGSGGNVQGIGIYKMNKEMTFCSKQTDYHERFAKLSGYMQFPIIKKATIKEILSSEEFEYFNKKMLEYEKISLVEIKEESYNLTKLGIFWGNNISSEIIIYIMEKIFNK